MSLYTKSPSIDIYSVLDIKAGYNEEIQQDSGG